MTAIRVISRLDIKGPNLVKGVHLEGLRIMGNPREFAERYYAGGADELLYMDIVASLYERNNLVDIVRDTAENIFAPMTVGGGVRSLEDFKTLLRNGADKISINTAAVKDPDLIRRAAEAFGRQCVVVSIEAKRQTSGRWHAFTDNGRVVTGLDVQEWACRAAELGAGEILLTSIDREGTQKGYDIELTRAVATSVNIPVIACGGAGSLEDVRDVIRDGRADAVCVAALFHYRKYTIHQLKQFLLSQGINVRWEKEWSSSTTAGPTSSA